MSRTVSLPITYIFTLLLISHILLLTCAYMHIYLAYLSVSGFFPGLSESFPSHMTHFRIWNTMTCFDSMQVQYIKTLDTVPIPQS